MRQGSLKRQELQSADRQHSILTFVTRASGSSPPQWYATSVSQVPAPLPSGDSGEELGTGVFPLTGEMNSRTPPKRRLKTGQQAQLTQSFPGSTSVTAEHQTQRFIIH
jgi:hypothetical protein